MKETIIKCDSCGLSPAASFTVPVEKYMDGAGSIDTRDATFDLCCGCTGKGLRYLLSRDEFSLRGGFVLEVLRKIVGKPINVS